MRRRWIIMLCLATCASLASRAGAQGWDNLAAGSRVSIRVADSLLPAGLARKNAIVGLVAQRAPEAIYLQITSDDTLRIARATISRMYVSHGISRRRTAIRTALFEGALFAALPPLRGEYFGKDHFQMIGIGTAAGAIIGGLLPLEHWKRLRP